MNARALTAVAIGGLIGAAVRWATIAALPVGSLHWGLLVANAVGSGILGYLLGRPGRLDELSSEIHLAATIGFCGSLTTLSGFSLVTAEALHEGHLGDAAIFATVSVASALGAAWSARKLRRFVAT